MDIKGFENYLIYPDGRVWSKIGKGRYLKPGIRRNYKAVLLTNGKDNHKSFPIHRLVAQHYIANPENKKEVDHINRNKLDNCVENLRWVTHSENMKNRVYKLSATGHRHITIDKRRGYEVYIKLNKKRLGRKYFKSKIDAICYKYVLLLKIKSRILY